MRRRLLAETPTDRGFTLIELLVVMIVLLLLIGIAVPAYLKFRDRGDSSAAQANIRAMIPAVEAYRLDNGAGGYAGMTIGGASGLQAIYDDALRGWNPATGAGVTILSRSLETYCLKSVSGGVVAYKNGPGREIVSAPACS